MLRAISIFLPGMQKTYYVLPIRNAFHRVGTFQVTPVRTKVGNTLHRSDLLLQENEVKTHDYCFFFNANASLMKPMTANDVLPTSTGKQPGGPYVETLLSRRAIRP